MGLMEWWSWDPTSFSGSEIWSPTSCSWFWVWSPALHDGSGSHMISAHAAGPTGSYHSKAGGQWMGG